jgi:hypothetical protein
MKSKILNIAHFYSYYHELTHFLMDRLGLGVAGGVILLFLAGYVIYCIIRPPDSNSKRFIGFAIIELLLALAFLSYTLGYTAIIEGQVLKAVVHSGLLVIFLVVLHFRDK